MTAVSSDIDALAICGNSMTISGDEPHEWVWLSRAPTLAVSKPFPGSLEYAIDRAQIGVSPQMILNMR